MQKFFGKVIKKYYKIFVTWGTIRQFQMFLRKWWRILDCEMRARLVLSVSSSPDLPQYLGTQSLNVRFHICLTSSDHRGSYNPNKNCIDHLDCSFCPPNWLKQIPVIAYKNNIFTSLRLCQQVLRLHSISFFFFVLFLSPVVAFYIWLVNSIQKNLPTPLTQIILARNSLLVVWISEMKFDHFYQ